MAESTIRKIKWFWPWQDEQEEAWLMSMSQKGWHLSSVGLPCIYRFLAGEKRDYVYRLDYPMYKKRDQQDYLQLFSDAGWEYLGNMSGWGHYFRKEVKEAETPEIFTDVESKVAKYKRVLTYLAFIAVIIIAISHNVWFDYPYSWWFVTRAIYLLLTVGLIYSIIRLFLRIRNLRRI